MKSLPYRHALQLTLAACTTLVLTLLASVTPALAVNLPDGRVYEEVTPVHMNGARAFPFVVSGGGGKVLYDATGAFMGRSGGQGIIPVAAVRTPTGWQNYEDLPPASEYHPGQTAFPDWEDLSSDLSKDLLWLSSLPFDTKTYTGPEPSARLYTQEASVQADGSALFSDLDITPQSGVDAGLTSGSDLQAPYLGGSQDLSHLIFQPDGAQSGEAHLIEDDLTNRDSPRYRFVDVFGPNNPDGSGTPLSECGASLGNGFTGGTGGHTFFHAISADGSTVFVTALRCSFFGGKNGPSVNEITARVNGSETIMISEPSFDTCPSFASGNFNPKCQPAQFEGASMDGSKVFFTSAQAEEMPGVTDETENLYEAEIGGTSTKSVTKMIQVSAGDSSGEGARVQGVVRISDDGSHIYFVAQSVLTQGPGPEGDIAHDGADNLYVYSEGSTKFIGELCSAQNLSGSVTDTHCPSADNLWAGQDNHPAWAAPFGSATSNGRFLIIDTSAQLITQGPEADTDTALDVYEYDSQTNKLVRTSTGRDGFDDNGNNNNFAATISNATYSLAARADTQSNSTQQFGDRPVSNDGSYVFFTTSEALVPDDVNDAPDVYEWHNGLVSLISDGQNPGREASLALGTANAFIGASADGKDVFFTTPDTLVAEGGDSPEAIYDARIGGGFPQAIVAPPCREDACQGTISPTPSFPSPSSSLYSTEMTLPVTADAKKAKAESKPRKVVNHKKKPKRHKARSGKHSKKGKK